MKYLGYIVLGVVVLVALIAVNRPSTPEEAERSNRRRAIELCWEGQARKSLTPAEARFIAGACEKMEADYRQLYGRAP